MVAKDPRAAEKSLPMCSESAGRTLSPADGHLAGWLRQEQAQLMCLSRHAPTASRHSPASKPRVCLLGRHLVERRPLGHTVAATDVNEVVRQCCRCCRCFELVLPAATACGWDLSPLIWSLAAQGQGRYGSVCVRVGAMPIERKTHPCTFCGLYSQTTSALVSYATQPSCSVGH